MEKGFGKLWCCCHCSWEIPPKSSLLIKAQILIKTLISTGEAQHLRQSWFHSGCWHKNSNLWGPSTESSAVGSKPINLIYGKKKKKVLFQVLSCYSGGKKRSVPVRKPQVLVELNTNTVKHFPFPTSQKIPRNSFSKRIYYFFNFRLLFFPPSTTHFSNFTRGC